MFERPRLMLWSAIIALTFVSISPAHASDAGRALSESHPDRGLSDVENPTTAAYGRDGGDVIEEIVVVGNKQRQRLYSDRISATRPAIEKPSQFELKLLPTYDPEEPNRHFGLAQHDEALGRVGIVTLFRLNFGR